MQNRKHKIAGLANSCFLFYMVCFAICNYYKYTKDSDYLIRHDDELVHILNSMDIVMDAGLAYAKPDWLIKYLMDNAELYEGIACAASHKVYLPALAHPYWVNFHLMLYQI